MCRNADFKRIDPDWLDDVLELGRAEIDEVRVDLAAHVVVGCARDQHAARVAKALQPRRDVHAVAENVVALDQDVAEVDAEAIEDAFVLGRVGVTLDHQRLDRDCAFDGGDDGGKLHQKPIAHRLDDAAAVVGDDRTRCLPMLAHRPRRPRLVLAH